MNEKALVLKPDLIKVVLEGEEYAIKYDLNAFCEMEKLYDSVDDVLQMLLGTGVAPDMSAVEYNGCRCLADDVTIAGVPLSTYITKINGPKTAKHKDTLNLLWLGCLHDHVVYDDDGNVDHYTITKAQLGSKVTFLNLKEVNAKLVTSILRDLLPAVAAAEAEKNSQPAE